jgi:hypothetical protein
VNGSLFDPTAFDNMKVVLEGAVYDRDLLGDILVVKRDDLVNLATLSRHFMMEFQLKESQLQKKVSGGIRLYASLENLSSELLTSHLNEQSNGSTVEIFIVCSEKLEKEQADQIFNGLEDIWGKQRTIQWTTSATKTNTNDQSFSSTFTISFDRLVKEEQMDDLVDMIEYLIQSLRLSETLL